MRLAYVPKMSRGPLAAVGRRRGESHWQLPVPLGSRVGLVSTVSIFPSFRGKCVQPEPLVQVEIRRIRHLFGLPLTFYGYGRAVGFDQKLLNPNEELVLDLRPHWWFIAPQTAALVGALVVGLIVLVADLHDALKVVAGLLIAIALVYWVIRYARWAGVNFVVTSERLIYRTGVVAKRGIEIPLERINTVFFNQSLFERMLGSGDLAVESAGEGGRQDFDSVRQPNRVQQEIYRAMELNEQRKLQAMGAAARSDRGDAPSVGDSPAQAASASSIPTQIQELDELRLKGVITDAEFETKKRELLDRM